MVKPILVSGIVVLLCSLGLLLLLVSFKTGNIETPQYTVIKTMGKVEIRQYPGMVVAQTTLSNSAVDKSMNDGFRTIAGYIFGGNNSNQKIAMTAPVVVKLSDTATMCFVKPMQFKKEQLPTPSSTKVNIAEEGEKTLAVLTYGGFSSPEKFDVYRKLLAIEL